MRLGIALAGGGIRGLAHAGVLKALEENDIKIDVIGGTSSGSIVGLFYAMGFSPYYIYTLAKKYATTIIENSSVPIAPEVGNFILNKKIKIKGLRDSQNIEKLIDEIANKHGFYSIKDIKSPLIIPAVDIATSTKYLFASKLPNEIGNSKYITDISIGKAIRSSCNFPVVFSPCEYDGHIFMDGAILDNAPALEIKKYNVDKILAIKFDSQTVTTESNIVDITMKIVDIMGNKISEESLNISDYVLTIPTNGTGILDIEKIDLCYNAGYRTAKMKMSEIKKAIQ